jgi:uncharacterized membrane protein
VETVLTEWLSLVLRWLHVVAAMAWIGSSFYFIHLDLSLRARAGLPAGTKGDAWQVHGGGFYHMVKYLVAPARMPDELTWFKWEAYTTWLSGFGLLVVVYYFGAELFLIDRTVLDLTPFHAAAIAFGSLLVAWLAYEGMCRSPLGRNELALALVGYVFLVGLTYAFTHVFSGRGALTQIGALIGTIMVANVFVIIIPNQKTIVADRIAGRVKGPWVGWGPYLWTDGMRARRDGLTWTCDDVAQDGMHPSPSGVRKVARLLDEFFASDSTARPWFSAGGGG